MGLFGSDKKTNIHETYSSQMDSYNTTIDTSQSTSSISETTMGLQGQDAVELAAIIEAGGTDRASLTSQALESIYQDVGNTFNQLIGGANALIQTSQGMSNQGLEQTSLFAQSMESVYGQGLETTKYLAQQGEQTISQAAMTSRALQGVEESSLEKALPLIFGGLLLFMVVRAGVFK